MLGLGVGIGRGWGLELGYIRVRDRVRVRVGVGAFKLGSSQENLCLDRPKTCFRVRVKFGLGVP